MSMTRVLYGLAALPLLAGVALAETPKQSNHAKSVAKQPMQLTEQQMDKVTAGWSLQEEDLSNTSDTWVSIYMNRAAPTGTAATAWGAGNTIICSDCYLLINGPAFSVASQIGP
jgi:hypothetical protein